MKWIKKNLNYKEITPINGNYFFAYYDLIAMNEHAHLTHKCEFIDRLQKKGDMVEVGYIPIDGGDFVRLDTTESWCFQQGAMLQFVPGSDNIIAYNVYENDLLKARFKDINGGFVKDIAKPISCISPAGDFYLSVNIPRLYDFRPGYGYACMKDPFYNENASVADGVFRVDISSGSSKMLISLEEISRRYAKRFPPGSKLCINHITVSPDGKRYNMLVRNMNTRPWITLVLIADTNGESEPYVLIDGDYASHYWWRDRDHILFYSDGNNGAGFYNYNVSTCEGEQWDPELFYFDGHMRVAPNGKYMVYDSYPVDGYRRLFIYDLTEKKGYEIGRFNSPAIDRETLSGASNDIRCDLHPRISNDSKFITIDTLHDGHRAIYKIDIPMD